MKKVLSIVLAIAMIASMSAVAFAADITALPDANTKIEVTGAYSDEQTDVPNYKVVLTWDALAAITFTDANENEWNVETHKWDVTEGGSWSAEEVALTVNIENHSCVDVKVSLGYEDAAGGAETALKAAVEDVIVDKAAVNETEEEAPKGTEGSISGTVTVGGRITEAEAGVMGTFTVTVAEYTAPVEG